MADVRQGRATAAIEGDFVVLLIGARLQVRRAFRSFKDLCGLGGMPGMLDYLSERPESGLIGNETYGLTMNVRYWRPLEHLERFANHADDPRLAVWRTCTRPEQVGAGATARGRLKRALAGD